MCGIVGVLRYGDLTNENKDNRNSALFLATTLLELTEPRGKDATGIAAMFDDGNFFGQKMAVRASQFVSRFGGEDGDFDGLQTVLRDYDAPLRTIIGHCRKKSVGGATDNVNNHPIKVGNIIGLHNGTLKNHDVIFENLKCGRDGDVDSEAIFRLLNYYTKNCKEPFTLEMLEEVTRRLEGSFSILAFNANNPNQVVSARDQRPAEYCLVRPLKMVLIASEKKFLETAIWNYNKMAWNFGITGFSKLKSSDIEMETLKDDTIALFDLTKEITDETKLKDLYETKDVPRVIDRIWKVPVKTTNYTAGNNYNNNRWNKNNTNGSGNSSTNGNTKDSDEKEDKKAGSENTTETNKTKSTDGKPTTDSSKVGMAWNSSLNKYVKAWNKRGDETNLILDTEKKLKMSLPEALTNNELDGVDSEPFGVEEEEKDGLDVKNVSTENYLVNQSVKINNIKPIESEETKTGPVVSVDKTTALAAMKEAAKTGKANSGYRAEAAKAAIESAKGLEKYSSAEEVATICSTDVQSLEKVPIVSLTNRLVRTHFADIFIQGYIAACEARDAKNRPDKVSRSQKHIRVLKGVTALMSGIMEEEIKNDDTAKWFKDWVSSKLVGEVTAENLREIFNSGDLRNNKIVRNMVAALNDVDQK